MKKFFEEFKKFALRGSVVDLAVGMIIGSAFTAIVTSLTSNFIQPILDFVTRAHPELYTGKELLGFLSAFISAIINFVIVAFVLFIIMKALNKIASLGQKSVKPTKKKCPFCKTDISIDAVRCPNCTSMLEEKE